MTNQTATSPTPQAVESLLQMLFTPSELYLFVRSGPFGSEIIQHLSDYRHTPHSAYVADVAGAYARRNLLTRDFFARLHAYRPMQASHISSLQRELCKDPAHSERVQLSFSGTTWSYLSPPEINSIQIGRQRPLGLHLSDKVDHIVVRSASSDTDSLKLSRKHLTISRIGNLYNITDHSVGGTTLNASKVLRDTPVPLQNGDILVLAGVLQLHFEVVFADPLKFGHSAEHHAPYGSLHFASLIGNLTTKE